MLKTKIFFSSDLLLLEKKINQWLEDTNWVKVVNICQSTGPEKTVISIWYEEPEVPILGK